MFILTIDGVRMGKKAEHERRGGNGRRKGRWYFMVCNRKVVMLKISYFLSTHHERYTEEKSE